ncbi:MAG: hypothetical protein ACREID_04495, partial [Planctomycetota bacterium]
MAGTAAETVFFMVRAALRLGSSLRRAYVDAARGRSLALPLPRAPGVRYDSARSWFLTDETGKRAARGHPRIGRLLALDPPNEDQKAELVDLYLVLYAERVPSAGEPRGQLSEEELFGLLEARQWAEGEFGGPPTALQQVAGTLVETAVDYFSGTPGAVSTRRPEGRALLAFLRAIDDVSFTDTPVRELAGDLLVAVLDGVAAHPDLAAGAEPFVARVARVLADSARAKLSPDAPTATRGEASAWLALVARALLKGGAEVVLENPARFLHVREGAEEDLVRHVGGALAELVIGEDAPRLRPLLSGAGLEKIARAALASVAKDPELLRTDHRGLQSILSALAGDLAELPGLFSRDLFPELARLVLEKSGEHLDLVWGKRHQSAGRHLLVTASRTLLRALSREPAPGATWRPRLSKERLLEVAEAVLDEVLDNPRWLVDEAGEASDTLGAA